MMSAIGPKSPFLRALPIVVADESFIEPLPKLLLLVIATVVLTLFDGATNGFILEAMVVLKVAIVVFIVLFEFTPDPPWLARVGRTVVVVVFVTLLTTLTDPVIVAALVFGVVNKSNKIIREPIKIIILLFFLEIMFFNLLAAKNSTLFVKYSKYCLYRCSTCFY